jgi:hypothetical protein
MPAIGNLAKPISKKKRANRVSTVPPGIVSHLVDQLSFEAGVLVDKSLTVELARDEGSKTWLLFSVDGQRQLRQLSGDDALDAFLKAQTEQEFLSCFRTFGPPRMPPDELAYRVSLNEVMTSQKMFTALLAGQLSINEISAWQNKWMEELTAAGKQRLFNPLLLPSLTPVWSSDFRVVVFCQDIYEMAAFALFLDRANRRERLFCRLPDCRRIFVRNATKTNKLYCTDECAKTAAKRKFKAKHKSGQ